jgi:hypothetical protein
MLRVTDHIAKKVIEEREREKKTPFPRIAAFKFILVLH